MQLCIVEDPLAANFRPLTYFRPVYDLRCGMLSIRDRIVRLLKPDTLLLHSRKYLRPLLYEADQQADPQRITPGRLVVVNGRVLMTPALAATLKAAREDVVFMAGQTPVAAVLGEANARHFRERFEADAVEPDAFAGLTDKAVDVPVVCFPWDLMYANEKMLPADFALLTRGKQTAGAQVHRSAVLLHRRNIRVGKGAVISPGVVVDAGEGPVLIGEGAKIYPNAFIEGPCYIGPRALIKVGAQIYGNTSIGELSKVGGEVEHIIVHSHANKQHDGFLGHSYICPWVNIGAGTVSSNLKNTYGTIRVQIGGQSIDTGRMFMGLLAGDHAKTGINVTLNTGTVLGPCGNIFGTVMPPKYIPPFSWGSGQAIEPYELEKALEVAATVMKRRNVELTAGYRAVFRAIHAMTSHERTSPRA